MNERMTELCVFSEMGCHTCRELGQALDLSLWSRVLVSRELLHTLLRFDLDGSDFIGEHAFGIGLAPGVLRPAKLDLVAMIIFLPIDPRAML